MLGGWLDGKPLDAGLEQTYKGKRPALRFELPAGTWVEASVEASAEASVGISTGASAETLVGASVETLVGISAGRLAETLVDRLACSRQHMRGFVPNSLHLASVPESSGSVQPIQTDLVPLIRDQTYTKLG